jgi:3-dehydroquinate synthetase
MSSSTAQETRAQEKRWQITAYLPVTYHITESVDILDPDNPDLLALPDGSRSRNTRLVVVDSEIARLYGERIESYFAAQDVDHELLVLPGDEENKEIDSVLRIASSLNDLGASRRADPLIAIGGGVVLDVAGLAASLYRRGIPYIRVPTTLLGLVDVSVAAKTGVNYDGFRNRLGSYSPPPRTLIDKTFLRTLALRQIRNGMGEIFKMGLIKDAELFGLLEEHGAELVDSHLQDGEVADRVIDLAIQGMVEELEPNLWERHLMRAVDYGHSFSPLIEMKVLPELLHGEAVALDCVFSAILAVQRGFLVEDEFDRVVRTAERIGLPVHHKMFTDPEMLSAALEDTVRHRNGAQNLPLMSRIGTARFVNDLTTAEITKAADTMARLGPET